MKVSPLAFVEYPVVSMHRIDHVVLVVRDLAQASWDFGGLGFNVFYGGAHASGETHNALIPFADGSYLELLAWKKRPGDLRGPADRWSGWRFRGEGLVDFALAPDDLPAALRGARERDIELLGPVPGGRSRPDGVEIAWELALPNGFDLPFLCADVTPRSLRVPGGSAGSHENGVTGIGRVTVDTMDVAASARRYRALVGVEPVPSPLEGSQRFQLDAAAIDLVWALRGNGVRSIELSCGPTGESRLLPPRFTHGASIEVVPTGLIG